MTIIEEGSEPANLATHHHHHLLGWLEDSISFLPTFLDDDPYSVPDDITAYEWWTQDHHQQHHLVHTPATTTAAETPVTAAAAIRPPPLTLQPEFSKKRKLPGNPTVAHRRRAAADEGDGEDEKEIEVPRKPPGNGRKTNGKGSGGNSGHGGSKEVRWAEQLLNPLAAAIDAVNLNRVQHLLYVLHELASPSADANHRLAYHGLRALSHRLAAAGILIPGGGTAIAAAPTFASTEPRLFRSALIKFHEVSPWFAFPNSLANASILQSLTLDSNHRPINLHVVDIGVSHGVQWPTLLDALTRRPGGAPSLVRLTVAGAAVPPGPFSTAAPGYDFPSHLLRYAKSIDLNLRIDRAGSLGARSLALAGDEILVVCAQFRAHHGDSDQRAAFLRSVRDLNPDLVVLSEIDGGGCGGGNFPAEFARRAEMLWRFLDSTSAAFKGRDCVERRLVEGEAARVLEGEAAAESRERWRERMVGLGFREEGFGEEAVEGGRALLRKYDGNWEMRAAAEAEAAAVGLWWKGQPVSFCSLWKPVEKAAGV